MTSKINIVRSWTTKAGLDACILLVGDSHHCGYVEVPAHLKGIELEQEELSVHGGITYQASPDWAGGKEVVGYDCAHWGDLQKCPEKYKGTCMEQMSMYSEGVWRDEAYCTAECESLAEQLIKLNTLPKPE